MFSYKDQLGNTITLHKNAQRIVSLVPSQTELLHALGLEDETVGITKFCVHPESWFRSKTRLGGTKDIKQNIIENLQPDLILANKEENVKEQVEALTGKFPVWISDVDNVASAWDMILSVGAMTGKEAAAQTLVSNINDGFTSLKGLVKEMEPIPVCYLIWQNPYMTIGGDTFINDMLARCGFQNVFATQNRYPQISPEDIANSGCKILFLASEPYPFKQSHADALQPALPSVKIILVDGEMFSWYGSRMLFATAYFQKLIQEVSLPC